MKNDLVKRLALILSLVMLLSLGACNKKNKDAEQSSTGQASFKPAEEFGVTEYGLIPESAFPNHKELEEWYEKSTARSSLVYAVYYAKDEASDVWYCWMYAEGFTYADTAELTVDDTDGTKVHINLTIQNEETATSGAFCFALPCDAEPTFALTVNGNTEGIIVTLGEKPAIPLK